MQRRNNIGGYSRLCLETVWTSIYKRPANLQLSRQLVAPSVRALRSTRTPSRSTPNSVHIKRPVADQERDDFVLSGQVVKQSGSSCIARIRVLWWSVEESLHRLYQQV